MEKLGIEPQLLLAQLVNFLIIFFVLSKLLYKPILGMLEKRKKEIAKGLELTAKMEEAERKLKEKEERLLQEARREARNIVEAGETEGEEVKKEIIANAHKEAEEIIAKGKADVDALKEKMMTDVRKSAVELAEAMTRRLVASVLSATEQHKLIARHIRELEARK